MYTYIQIHPCICIYIYKIIWGLHEISLLGASRGSNFCRTFQSTWTFQLPTSTEGGPNVRGKEFKTLGRFFLQFGTPMFFLSQCDEIFFGTPNLIILFFLQCDVIFFFEKYPWLQSHQGLNKIIITWMENIICDDSPCLFFIVEKNHGLSIASSESIWWFFCRKKMG